MSDHDSIEQPVLVSANEYKRITRRELLRLAPLAVSSALLFPSIQKRLIHNGLGLSDWASAKGFRQGLRARTFRDSEVTSFAKFPYNYSSILDPGIDLRNWSLRVEGLVERPGSYSLSQIQGLRKINQNTRHICIEGWDVIGNFGGCRISDFLALVGLKPGARFVEVECADDYYESIDLESALHPQSLLCYEMYGAPLDRGHGAPLRLQMPVKLGYKQAKYLTALRVTSILTKEKGFWEDQGYSWFGGI
jgi:DMSO/TMAO reductase YedYZ molybdopterin-dependent catalytic subunit